MGNKITTFSLLCFGFLLFVQCKITGQSSDKPGTQNKKAKQGLKDYYKKYFPIGAAVGLYNLKGDEAGLILQEFNSLTPE
ncbi:MAG: hypothetical protein ABIO55_09170, partial [Ginsengibacter sp.]